MKLRRSLLYMPGTDWRKIEKAATEIQADSVCMDLEDGVAVNAKEEGRRTIVRALEELDFGRSERLVRVNNMESGFVPEDLAAVLPANPDGIVLPKVGSGDEVAWLDQQISTAEAQSNRTVGRVPLILIIESAMGIVNLKDIVSASRRTVGLVFGAEDFAGDIGAVRSQQGAEVFYARSKVVTYARAFGLQAIDIVFADFRDADGFKKDADSGLRLGYTGKQLIHPNQVPLIHEVYTPSDDEIAYARRVVETHDVHQAGGTGAFALDGKMVDMPVVRQAQLILERARAAGK